MRVRGSGSIFKPKGKRFLRAIFSVNGRRYNESTRTVDLAKAEEYLARRVRALTSPDGPPACATTLEEALRATIGLPPDDRFWRHPDDGPVLLRFFGFVGDRPASDPTDSLYEYLDARVNGGKVLSRGGQPLPAVEPSTVRHEISIIKRYFRKAWARGLIGARTLGEQVPRIRPGPIPGEPRVKAVEVAPGAPLTGGWDP